MPAYVDRRVSDLAAATSAAHTAAGELGVAGPDLIRHGMNAIFRCDDVVLRVATPNVPAEVSIRLAQTLIDIGVPIARPASGRVVEAHGHSVTAWEHVESSDDPIDWHAVGAVVRSIQRIDVDDVPDGVPVPSPVEFPWWNHELLMAEVDDLLDDGSRSGLRAAIDRHAGWRDWSTRAAVLCHGDVHPGNVIMTVDGPVLVDWDLLCRAPRGWDHAPMMTWAARWGGAAGAYSALASGAGWDATGDRFGEAFAELRLVSATLMRLKVARSTPAAMPEAKRRLAYWRGHDDAPIWQAQ